MIYYCESNHHFISTAAMLVYVELDKFYFNRYDQTIAYPVANGEVDIDKKYNLISDVELQDVMALIKIGD